jgi:uncharacterized surface protein with fasciclin (FAS1) repeats
MTIADFIEFVEFGRELSFLSAALVRAGLVESLKSDEVNLTLFAPNNDAFGKVPASVVPPSQ